jgi:hypothetical protein
VIKCAKCPNPIGPNDAVERETNARGNTVFVHAVCFWRARAAFVAQFVRILAGAVAGSGGALRVRAADLVRAAEHRNEIEVKPAPDESGDLVVSFSNLVVPASQAMVEVKAS